MTKEHVHVAVLLSVGGIGLLVWLKRSGDAVGGGAVAAGAPAVAASPTYPNAAPITPLNFQAGDSPINLTYNTSPPTMPADYQIGEQGSPDGCGCLDSCTQAQQASIAPVVPPAVAQAASDNLSSYVAKKRVSFTTF